MAESGIEVTLIPESAAEVIREMSEEIEKLKADLEWKTKALDARTKELYSLLDSSYGLY
jgi:hypothetical protein